MGIVQYPHFLFLVESGTESVQDEYGNWSDAEPKNKFISVCREETNGKGTQIQTAGGKFILFAALIQLPKDCGQIDTGATVFISNDADGNDIRVRGTVLKFDEGQLHSRLWV